MGPVAPAPSPSRLDAFRRVQGGRRQCRTDCCGRFSQSRLQFIINSQLLFVIRPLREPALWRAVRVTGGNAQPVVGTCELMCPPAEREQRERNGNIRLLERPDPAKLSVSSPELAVKTFARTGVRSPAFQADWGTCID